MTASPLAPQDAAPDRLQHHHLHFVGIGGCGMSGLARLALAHGARCTGTDRSDSTTVRGLRQAGIPVALEQSASSVPKDASKLIISAAIPPDHAEVAEARKRGMPVVKYAQLLGQLMAQHVGVAVAGTHGKSSTTSMLSHTLIEAGLDPSLIVGAYCSQIGGGWRVGRGPHLVAEACEYDRSFHALHPMHAIILNVEEDHLDLYGNLDAVIESFRVFAERVPANGSLLIQHTCPHRDAITAGLSCNIETIGSGEKADWRVSIEEGERESDLRLRSSGPRGRKDVARGTRTPVVRLYHQGERVASWLCPLPGAHMAYNSAAAAITAHRLGAAWPAVSQALAGFQGLDRRMQRLGKRSKFGPAAEPVTVVDDYGHHPTEVHATLLALRQHYRPRRLVCVFQPHQHSRTRFFMDQFVQSFSQADVVIVPRIYFVRDSEADRKAVTASNLVDRLREIGVNAQHIPELTDIVNHLEEHSEPGDLVVTMGAGDVWRVGHAFASAADEAAA